MRGIIIRWDDERGFGFVKEEITKTEIFVHISAFNFVNPRPEVGDQIEFDTSYNEEKERTEIIKAVHLIKKPALSLVKEKRKYNNKSRHSSHKKGDKYYSSKNQRHRNNHHQKPVDYAELWWVVAFVIILVLIIVVLLFK